MTVLNLLRKSINKESRVAVLGIGSELCGDDAAGMLLIDQLQKYTFSDNVLLMPASTAPENFTGLIKDFQPDLLIVVDAVFAEKEVGEIFSVNLNDIMDVQFSTHMMPFGFILSYLKQATNSEFLVIGIQPDCTEFATEPCQQVRKAAGELADMIGECLCDME